MRFANLALATSGTPAQFRKFRSIADDYVSGGNVRRNRDVCPGAFGERPDAQVSAQDL
jgi:ribosomal 50S subunit-recycling heat shock protein